jgi:hypothetical protein
MFDLKFPFLIPLPRPDDGTMLPAMLAALLLAAVAAQLLLTGGPELPAEGVGRIAASMPSVRVARAGSAPDILARPLFSPTRNSDGGGATGGGAGTMLGGAVVAGTVSRGRSTQAFVRLPDGSIRTLRIGQQIEGWRLAGLTGDSARFARDGQTISIAFGSSAPMQGDAAEDDENSEEE